MDERSFHGWVRPGPLPPGGVEPGEHETLDSLCGSWRIFQYRRGHRFSVDDLLTAWFGTVWCPSPSRIADLGSGIGSVALTAAWRCPGAFVCTVEAQEQSLHLAEKSVRYNGVGERFRLYRGDLRDPAVLAGEEPFDLVLGSPPYWPEGSRSEAVHPQTIPARFEVRGGVEDYARTAFRLLAPGGLFALVFARDQAGRAEEALRAAGLVPLHRQDVWFKEGEDYGLVLLAATRRDHLPEGMEEAAALPLHHPPLVVRDAAGRFTPAFALIRLALGFPPGLPDRGRGRGAGGGSGRGEGSSPPRFTSQTGSDGV